MALTEPVLAPRTPIPERATLIATATRVPSAQDLAALPDGVDWIEIRADQTGELADDALGSVRASGRKLLYTLRSRAEGGGYEASDRRRHDRLIAAAAKFDLVDLEADRDLDESVLEAIPAERRLLSWHGGVQSLDELKDRVAEMSRTPARWYKLIPEAMQPGDEVTPLMLLGSLGRRDVVSFASGPIASWTRPVAPRFGAPLVYGALDGESPGAAGQMSIRRLVDDFDLPRLWPVDQLRGVAGCPIDHSLSPRLHNRAYRDAGLDALYLPFHVEHFGDFWLDVVESRRLGMLGIPITGLSVTAPHKAVALAVSGASSPLAESLGGANTLTLTEGVWEAETTDPFGVAEPIRRRGIDLSGRPVAVVGAGGAGRAAAAALDHLGAEVILFNRNETRGREAAKRLHLSFRPLHDLNPGSFRALVHATSLGREAETPAPIDVGRIERGAVVIDLVYGPRPTALIEAAERAGAVTIDGREVLLWQASKQFELMTGRVLPLDLGRAVLGLEPVGDNDSGETS